MGVLGITGRSCCLGGCELVLHWYEGYARWVMISRGNELFCLGMNLLYSLKAFKHSVWSQTRSLGFMPLLASEQRSCSP